MGGNLLSRAPFDGQLARTARKTARHARCTTPCVSSGTQPGGGGEDDNQDEQHGLAQEEHDPIDRGRRQWDAEFGWRTRAMHVRAASIGRWQVVYESVSGLVRCRTLSNSLLPGATLRATFAAM
jgi:hypothetical protein